MGVHWLASFFFPAPEHRRAFRADDDKLATGEKSKGRWPRLWLPVAGGGALLVGSAEYTGAGRVLTLFAHWGFPFLHRLEALPIWLSERPFRQPRSTLVFFVCFFSRVP